MKMIELFYKCACMPGEASVEVPPRREGEDIAEWMGLCTAALTLDHRKRNPHCRAKALEYAKIPAPENAPFLGGQPKVN